MTAIRSSKLTRTLSIAMTLMMVALLMPAGVIPQAAADQGRMLLVFPVVDTSEGNYPDAARRMTDALQIAIDGIPGLQAAEFSRTSPLVRRAVEEGQIRSVDVETEIADPVTALRIGYALGADEVCLATITGLTVTEDPRQISLLLTGQCYSVQQNMDMTTGQVNEQLVMSNSFGVSGESTARVNYQGPDSVLLNQAIRSAANKAAQVLAGMPAQEVPEGGAKKPSKAWKWFLAGLLIAGLAMAANTATDNPPVGPGPNAVAPRPLRVILEPTAIRLEWQAPQGTSLTVLRYQIQRSQDNGQTWSFIDEGVVEATDTSFGDFLVTSGTVYQYRIRALYTASGPSPWANFEAIQFSN